MIRKFAFTIAVVSLVTVTASSQALEIINAIAGTLLPKVVDGIKQIRDSRDNSRSTVKVDRADFNNQMKDINAYMNGITSAIASDAKSLKVIGDLSSSGGLLYDNLGAMYSMSNKVLIQPVIDSHVDIVQRAYAQAFYRDLQQLRKDIGQLQTDIPSLTIDASLKQDLVQKVTAISSDNTDLQSYLATSGVDIPTETTSAPQIVNYLEKIKDAGRNLDNLKLSIQGMLGVLSARLGTYVNNATTAKDAVDTKFKEIIVN